MGDPLRFDGRVVLVTGAGNGLGREYALEFARRGAAVVVNDLGGSHTGAGRSSAAAEKVVAEIRAAGGKAVSNCDSVEDGAKLVQTALDEFGRIDVVVNNAGILRDKSFARISDADWDIVHRVHLRGSFLVTRAAWPHFKKQNYGRVIMTSSASGVYGNYGQANYSAAKLGALGLANTLAVEGLKHNILCNTIAPSAGSRMTKSVMPEELLRLLRPQYVAPLVVFLCHEASTETHGLFEVGAGWAAKVRLQRSRGKMLRTDSQDITAEAVRDNWEAITDFSGGEFPESIQDNTNVLLQHVYSSKQPSISASPSTSPTGGSGGIDIARAIRTKFPATEFRVTPRDLALYALGVGASMARPTDLRFLYERSDEFVALPTFGVIPAQAAMDFMGTSGIDSIEFNPMMLLHGEQFLRLYRPMPTEGRLTSQAKLVGVLDKGSGLVLILNVDTKTAGGERVCSNQYTIFIRGLGGFGGPKSSNRATSTMQIPEAAPEKTACNKTGPSQAALYRLSGDLNPLHVDANLAAVGGFDKPILHGLCTFGYAGRHILAAYCDNDPAHIKCLKVRFSKPVYPGESIETQMWRRGNRIQFQCRVPERDNVVVLASAYAELRARPPSLSAGPPMAATPLQAAPLFDQLAQHVGPELVDEVGAIFQWNIQRDGQLVGQWTVDLKNKPGAVYSGPAKEKPGCTLTIEDDSIVPLTTGKLSAMRAYMTGKLKVGGNMMLSQRLEAVFARLQPTTGTVKPTKTGATPTQRLQAAAIFKSLEGQLGEEVVRKIGAVFQWDITNGKAIVASWTTDLKNGAGSVREGAADTPADCTLRLADADLAAMVAGKLDAMKAYFAGKLKVSGNLMLAQKLGGLLKGLRVEVPAAGDEQPQQSGPELKARAVFEDMAKRITPAMQKKINAVVRWDITLDGSVARSWTTDLKTGTVSSAAPDAAQGAGSAKPDCTLTLSDADLVAIAGKQLSPMSAFMRGRLKVKGNVALAQRLQTLFATTAKL